MADPLEYLKIFISAGSGGIVTTIAVLKYFRRAEKRVDDLETAVFGRGSLGGYDRRLTTLEQWKEDFRAGLPMLLQETRHAAAKSVAKRVLELGGKVENMETLLGEKMDALGQQLLGKLESVEERVRGTELSLAKLTTEREAET